LTDVEQQPAALELGTVIETHPNGLLRWVMDADGVKPEALKDGRWSRDIAFAPFRGGQERFLSSPVYETLAEGDRGGGKTSLLIADFMRHVGCGFGAKWTGVLVRRSYKEFADVVEKAKELIPKFEPRAKWHGGLADYFWSFPGGEILYLRRLAHKRDFAEHKGHERPWLGFNELTEHPNDQIYKLMMSVCRSSDPRVAAVARIRADTNPDGPGHGWVKLRFKLPLTSGRRVGPVIRETDSKTGLALPPRVAIHCPRSENLALRLADPGYEARIAASADTLERAKAWIHGDWNIVAGALLSECWSHEDSVIPAFDIPRSWRMDRSFDWGSSKPFSVLWWAESDGTSYKTRTGDLVETLPGDLFLVGEWYGSTGEPNQGLGLLDTEISRGIRERELERGWHNVHPGPADSAIWTAANGKGVSNADDMAKPVKIKREVIDRKGNAKMVTEEHEGIRWTKADKYPDSVKHGAQAVRALMKGAWLPPEGHREEKGLFVFEHCTEWLRTVPIIPRSEKDPDKHDTDAEDHAYDATRYRIQSKRKPMRQRETVGLT
jgi:hypothetical protein